MHKHMLLHSQYTNLINICRLQASVSHDSGSSRVKINIAGMEQDKDNTRTYVKIQRIMGCLLTSRKDHPPGGKPQPEGNHQHQACLPLPYHREGCLSNKQRSIKRISPLKGKLGCYTESTTARLHRHILTNTQSHAQTPLQRGSGFETSQYQTSSGTCACVWWCPCGFPGFTCFTR